MRAPVVCVCARALLGRGQSSRRPPLACRGCDMSTSVRALTILRKLYKGLRMKMMVCVSRTLRIVYIEACSHRQAIFAVFATRHARTQLITGTLQHLRFFSFSATLYVYFDNSCPPSALECLFERLPTVSGDDLMCSALITPSFWHLSMCANVGIALYSRDVCSRDEYPVFSLRVLVLFLQSGAKYCLSSRNKYIPAALNKWSR